jgi:propionyl-CoA carboxylase alpha chain
MVTGLDLVELQLLVASGEPLPIRQEDVRISGWAIEARICAEDPLRNFLPSTGIITRYAVPRGKRIRLDSGIEAGSVVTVFYDSMLSKLVVGGEDREEARQTIVGALNRYHIEGVVTNKDFVNAILNHPAFISGDLSTGFIDEHFPEGQMRVAPQMEKLHFMVMAATLVYHNRQNLVRDSLKPMAAKVGQAHEEKAYHEYVVKGEENLFHVRLSGDTASNHWAIHVNDKDYQVVTPHFEFYRRRLKLSIDGQDQYFHLQYRENFIWTAFCGITRTFEIYSPKEWELAGYMPTEKRGQKEDVLLSPMPGLVVDIKVTKGDWVYRGQDLVIIESMKMESGVSSPCDGEVEEINIQVGQTVETGDVMLVFKS